MTMIGPWGAKTYINNYLAEDMPERIVKYRNAWNLDDVLLPLPEVYIAHEPEALDYWPHVATVAVNVSRLNRLDYATAGDPIYAVTYAMRTYVWVRQEKIDVTTQSRDNLTTVMRSALLDRPCLRAGVHGYHGIHEVSMDEGSLREEYSDCTRVKGERYVAGAYLSYEFTVEETVRRDVLGTMTSASVSILDLT